MHTSGLKSFVDYGGIRLDMGRQYTYCRSPLYCLINRQSLDIAGWNAFDWQDCSIDAPECLPVGSSHGSDEHGRRTFKNFVWREWDDEADAVRRALSKQLILEVVDKLKAENELQTA